MTATYLTVQQRPPVEQGTSLPGGSSRQVASSRLDTSNAIREASSMTVDQEVWFQVFDRDKGRCRYCNADLTSDILFLLFGTG
jgi:hypothetical protein